jgi:hypothetical protein
LKGKPDVRSDENRTASVSERVKLMPEEINRDGQDEEYRISNLKSQIFNPVHPVHPC